MTTLNTGDHFPLIGVSDITKKKKAFKLFAAILNLTLFILGGGDIIQSESAEILKSKSLGK